VLQNFRDSCDIFESRAAGLHQKRGRLQGIKIGQFRLRSVYFHQLKKVNHTLWRCDFVDVA